MLKKSKFFTLLVASLFAGSFIFVSCDNAKTEENTDEVENVENVESEDAAIDQSEDAEKCGEGKCGDGKEGKEVLPTRAEAEAAAADKEQPKEVKATRAEAEKAATSKCGDGADLQEKATEEVNKGAKKIEGRVGK